MEIPHNIPALEKISAEEIREGDKVYHALDGTLYGPVRAQEIDSWTAGYGEPVYVEINAKPYQENREIGYLLILPDTVVYRAVRS